MGYKLKYKQKYGKGVPVGYKHRWKYNGRWNETKISPRLWKFRFVATKKRGGSSKGGLKRGGRMLWAIKGIQSAVKIGGRKYLTDFRGYKKQLGYSYRGEGMKYNKKRY